ncbi:DeoR/GlpR family DNA-binding transcription regulator [Olegusella massiliensis]|uniref:DeoR/GlpR family DNA-binding transcription regulator n=1 Tax=Olegusella massiliensis TaxID=1776381 RepID=UPI0008389769|nr:DeoR/GlpR family DNA-binding transcription regulator [Olegusella massiliensis]
MAEQLTKNTTSTSHSFVEDRRSEIMNTLEQKGKVRVDQLAALFGVSRVTIRGDLDALSRDGRLKRTHGGAVALSKTVTTSIQEQRINVNAEAKRRIALRAAQLVPNGSSILLDSGTTAIELVRALNNHKNLTVVTNDLSVADLVDRSMPAADVIFLGGLLRKGHRYVSGPLTLRSLDSLRPDIAFVCPTAFVPQRGFMTNNQAMAALKEAFCHCADKTYILMDSSKLGATGLLRFGDVSDVDAIVTEADPAGLIAAAAENGGAQLIVA